MLNIKNKLPDCIKSILLTLNMRRQQAYLVGGAVRSYLLGLEPKDYDICTSATPDEVVAIFQYTNWHCIPTGIEHGTITLHNKEFNLNVEITTMREDGNYSDGRRPDEVIFTTDILKDLARRDFTMNAIAYDMSEDKIIDPYDGVECIKNKVVRAVGEAGDRYREDALRMLRAIRFSSQLHFSIRHDTSSAILKNAELIKNISAERVAEELNKILLSDNAGYGLEYMQSLGIMKYIIPELEDCVGFEQYKSSQHRNVFEHTLLVVDASQKDIVTRWAALLHDIGKPDTFTLNENGIGQFIDHHIVGAEKAEVILRRLKFPNSVIDSVVMLIRHHMSRYSFLNGQGSPKAIKKLIQRVGLEDITKLINLQRADIMGSGRSPWCFGNIDELEESIQQILEAKEPMTIKDLAINGNHLMALGIPQGKMIGETLNKCLEVVLEYPEKNNYTFLEGLAIGYNNLKVKY